MLEVKGQQGQFQNITARQQSWQEGFVELLWLGRIVVKLSGKLNRLRDQFQQLNPATDCLMDPTYINCGCNQTADMSQKAPTLGFERQRNR